MKTTTLSNSTAKKTRPAELKLATKAPNNSSLSSNGTGDGDVHSTSSNPNAPDDNSVISSVSGESLVVKSQSPPWKKTFDYLADQAFNVCGVLYLIAIGAMAGYYMNRFDMNFLDEFQSAVRLMMFYWNGLPFFSYLGVVVTLRWLINKYAYPIVLHRIYEGKNHKFTGHYCEWLFDAIKNTVMFCMGFYVAFGSEWAPVPTAGKWLWYPPQGGTIFDSNGAVIPTRDVVIQVVGHGEITIDSIALLTLVYDAWTEYVEAKAAQKVRHGDQNQKQATTTTSFTEDFIHHTGVCFGALYLYITAKDNCNGIAIIVLLGQFNDMCEFAALALGLCKNWFLERVVTPTLCVFWTISLFYVWPATLIPIFMEEFPVEVAFSDDDVLHFNLYKVGMVSIALLFWAMHMFWLYKGLLFLYRYNSGVYFSQKRLKIQKDKDAKAAAATASLSALQNGYSRTACLASGTLLKPTKEE